MCSRNQAIRLPRAGFWLVLFIAVLMKGCGDDDSANHDTLLDGSSPADAGDAFVPMGRSDPFPPSAPLLSVADLLPAPAAIYYCATDGDNDMGDGSELNPWRDLIGASTGGSGDPVGPGSIIYFRGGTYGGYPYTNFSYSENRLTIDGEDGNPIIITNHPQESVLLDYMEHWALTLDGENQVLMGSMVGDEHGIHIHGGMTVRGNDCKVIGVEFSGGSSNGGDTNPAMISVPLNDGCSNLLVSHCHFHDAHHVDIDRMVSIRLFTTTNIVVEHNLFENNVDVYQGGGVYFKDSTTNATVRYNRFYRSAGGVSFVVQGGPHDGIDVHHNLFVEVDNPIFFINELGTEILVHENVAILIPPGRGFLYYLNGDNADFQAHGEYYDNVIDGPGFEQGYIVPSDLRNLPDVFDWNLWYRTSDQTSPFGADLPPGYFEHAVVSDGAVQCDLQSLRCTVDHDYAGIGAGRYGGSIGGFNWSN